MDSIDPVGEWRADFRTAELISLIVNIVTNLYSKEGATKNMTTPLDFMVDWSGEKEQPQAEQSVEEMKQALMSFAREHNKKVKKLKLSKEKLSKPPRNGPANRKISSKSGR